MKDDTIRRSDAIAEIRKARTPDVASHQYAELFINAVCRAPSTDRPQGEWIRDRYWSRGVGMGEEYGFFYKCSLCEYEVENGYTRCGFNFCPYCGADMRERKDERDYL